VKTIVVYAWCFSHGTLHRFQPAAEPWCTASWVHLDAYSEEVALAIKQRAWGDARFLHELAPDKQLAIIGLAEGRRTPDDGPSVRDCAADDRRWFDGEKTGE
jgi:hypothetical protein